MRQRFVQGVGGTLRFLPPDVVWLGRPATPTVTLKSTRGTDLPTPVVSAAATLDPVDTTTTADALQDTQVLTLASVSGIFPLRRYLLTNSLGAYFLVEVALVEASSKKVTLFEKLSADVATGATFKGVELSVALSGAQCPDPLTHGHLYRAVWAYTLSGVPYSSDQLYEVRKRLLRPTLTADEVQRKLPAPWSDLSDEGPRAIARAIDDAWDDLLDELAARGFDPDRIMDSERLRRPHRSLVLAQLGTTWGKDWKEWAGDHRAEHNQDLADALAAGDWYDKVQDAVQANDETKVTTIILGR